MPVVPGKTSDTDNFSSPVCMCGTPVPRPGIATGFWEPIALVDITKDPFCFVNLGGVSIGAGILNLGRGADPVSAADASQKSFHHVHYYKYPASFLLNVTIDAACLEVGGFDLAYMSEVDPLWHDDELAFILNGESLFFANPIAQGACIADCAKASVHIASNSLFWCAGCQGGMYPFTGNVPFTTMIQSTLLTLNKLLFKMHRSLLALDTSSNVCASTPAPIIKKSQYRTGIVNPVPATSAFLGCQPLGRTTLIYEAGRVIPAKAENFGYLLWRKRNCCVL